ncbi:MAG: ABC transporter permease [Lachnospiraceae bacterium]|nr:ABC transporter permease [Lachnospiraceae bacterium]
MLNRHASLSSKRRLVIFLVPAAVLLLLSLFAPLLAPNDPNATSAMMMNHAPCADYPFGTDQLGRCICSRVLMGAGTSIFSAALLVILTFLAGATLGILAGWYGGIADAVIMRICDVMLAFPQMVLAIAVAGILGGGMTNAMLAMGISGWTLYARLARAQVLSLKEEPYVQAARLSGLRFPRIMFGTLLPNILGPLVVNATTQIGVMMIGIAGLSFLGIGVTEPHAEWGSMINFSRSYIRLAPWAVFAPAAAIVLTVMVFNCLGDSIRDYLDVGGEK